MSEKEIAWIKIEYKDGKIEHINDINLFEPYNKLRQENQHLKEQVEYLRRSIERKEETIIDLRNDNTLCSKEYVSKLEKEKQELIDYLKKKKSDLHWELSELTSGMCNTKFQEGKMTAYEEILSKIEKSDK